MLLTTTPPPPNIDAAAATAVAVNASAITLSPGRMPVASIAAVAPAANTSAITPFPGSMPVAAIGLNVGGMNLNVTFAPLGVSSGQQNSGNSAGLQPTTQLNLGFSTGLVGGFGATHSGSTSTTTQSNLDFSASLVGGFGATHSSSTNTTIATLGSKYVPRKKGNSSMLSPYSGSIKPSSLTGIAKYINFVKLSYNK
jgi:hypothetical protein